MREEQPDRTLAAWRMIAGLLAVVAIGLGVLRLLALIVGGLPEGISPIGYSLRIAFPVGIGLAFGYFALSKRFWGGKDGSSS